MVAVTSTAPNDHTVYEQFIYPSDETGTEKSTRLSVVELSEQRLKHSLPRSALNPELDPVLQAYMLTLLG